MAGIRPSHRDSLASGEYWQNEKTPPRGATGPGRRQSIGGMDSVDGLEATGPPGLRPFQPLVDRFQPVGDHVKDAPQVGIFILACLGRAGQMVISPLNECPVRFGYQAFDTDH